MFGLSDLERQNILLKARVKELEERLCPCSSHEWIEIGGGLFNDNYGNGTNYYKYRCKRCGKEATSSHRLEQ